MTAKLLQVSVIVDDPAAAMAFYQQLFDAAEEHTVNPEGYRGVIIGDGIIGFNEPAVRPKLGLQGSHEHAERPTDDVGYFTILLSSRDEVDEKAARAVELGANVIAGPLVTPFNWYVTVLRDPQGIPFRLATTTETVPRLR